MKIGLPNPASWQRVMVPLRLSVCYHKLCVSAAGLEALSMRQMVHHSWIKAATILKAKQCRCLLNKKDTPTNVLLSLQQHLSEAALNLCSWGKFSIFSPIILHSTRKVYLIMQSKELANYTLHLLKVIISSIVLQENALWFPLPCIIEMT